MQSDKVVMPPVNSSANSANQYCLVAKFAVLFRKDEPIGNLI